MAAVLRAATNLVAWLSAFAIAAMSIACNALTGADELSAQAQASSRWGADAGKDDGDDEDEPSAKAPASGTTGGSTADAGTAANATTTDAGTPSNAFLDDFGRANGALGNGWVERTAGTYVLNAGLAVQNAERSLPKAITLRPTSEAALDVEVSVVVRPAGQTPDPGVYARMQPTSATELSGYGFFLSSPSDATIEREDLSAPTPLGGFTLSPPVANGESLRLVLRVTGTDPVRLAALVVDGAGNMRGSATLTDASPARVTKAGVVGFGGQFGLGTRFDDFRRALVPGGT